MCVGGILFFQAEDGIRDLVRSRGLGDVYKRQVQGTVMMKTSEQDRWSAMLDAAYAMGCTTFDTAPVSYTHLTLPTIYSV